MPKLSAVNAHKKGTDKKSNQERNNFSVFFASSPGLKYNKRLEIKKKLHENIPTTVKMRKSQFKTHQKAPKKNKGNKKTL